MRNDRLSLFYSYDINESGKSKFSMPDRSTIERVAKILARAGSDNPNEAVQALHGAYKRMVRDGVSLSDLLSLPLGDLYQDTLVKLVDMILADQPGLSPSSKRAAYSEYMRLIVTRFSGEPTGGSTQSQASSETGRGQQSREEEARQYEQRRRQQESERRKTTEASGSESQTQDSQFGRQNSFMSKWENIIKTFKIGRVVFSFSPATFFPGFQGVFGRGSITWHIFHAPGRALRLFAASFLYGLGFASVILMVIGLVHAVAHIRPIIDFRLKDIFAFIAAFGVVIKARRLFLDGWFR
jgi:hypothetical protein